MTITLEHIGRKHKEWVRVAIYLGAESWNAEDYVQTMYLKLADIQAREGDLNRLRNHAGEINTVYVFKILTNLIVDQKRKPNREDNTNEFPDNGENHTNEEQAYMDLMDCIREEISNMHSYDQMLLELHFVYGMSMRQIELQTNIPTHSIFNTLKNAKIKIKQKASARYSEYLDERNNRQETGSGTGGRNPENNESDWD